MLDLMHSGSTVEHPAVNGLVIGSIPICAAITDGKRIGKQLVLKTGARKGCRFESMHRPPCTKSTMVVQTLDKRSALGSSPSSCNSFIVVCGSSKHDLA